MAWTEKYCRKNEGTDFNTEEKKKSRAAMSADWEFDVKITLLIRDLMTGNKKLEAIGFKEEAIGHNALAAGLQRQRQWTDFLPNGDFPKQSSTAPSTGTASGKLLL